MTHFARRAIAGLTCLVLVVLTQPGEAARQDPQSVPEPELKAAFLYNFAKFTEWPGGGAPAGLTFCIADDAIADALRRLVAGRLIDGRQPHVRRVALDESLAGCAVLYAGHLDEPQTRALVESLKGGAVLSVGESDRFAIRGGIVGLFIETGQVRFAVNVGAAGRARLRLSSQLLSLARIIKDVVE